MLRFVFGGICPDKWQPQGSLKHFKFCYLCTCFLLSPSGDPCLSSTADSFFLGRLQLCQLSGDRMRKWQMFAPIREISKASMLCQWSDSDTFCSLITSCTSAFLPSASTAASHAGRWNEGEGTTGWCVVSSTACWNPVKLETCLRELAEGTSHTVASLGEFLFAYLGQ